MKHAKDMKRLLDISTQTFQCVNGFKAHLKECIADAIDEKVASEGGVNMSILEGMLNNLENKIVNKIETVAAVATVEATRTGDGISNLPLINAGVAQVPSLHQFSYADEKGQMRHWCVPESFLFPKEASLKTGWRLWLTGAVHFDDSKTPWKVKPYRELTERDMKCEAMKGDVKAWRGIFKLMESAVTMPGDETCVDQAFVDSSYETAYGFLKTNYSYIFLNAGDAT